MHLVNSKSIKWEVILNLFEVQQYLSIDDFIRISLLNKLLRSKLKRKIFHRVQICYSNLSQALDFSNSDYFRFENDFVGDLEAIKARLNYKIDPFIDELISEIECFSTYFKSLKLSFLGRECYFILNSIYSFNQLSCLIMCDCYIGLKDFNQLMSKLSKLEKLDLQDIKFMKDSMEGPIESDIALPTSLIELSLSNLHLGTANNLINLYQSLFNYDTNINTEVLYLPPQHLPNLKKFLLYTAIEDNNFINDFISLNPQLLSIKLSYSNLNFEFFKILSKNNNLKHAQMEFNYYEENIFNEESLPVLHSLNSLFIPYISRVGGGYLRIYQIIDACPNLTKVDFAIKDYNVNLINRIIENLKQLNTMVLKIYNLSTKEVDLTLFKNIKCLKLSIFSDYIINYKLPSPPIELRSVTISANKEYIENYNFMKKTYKDGSGWVIKLAGEAIICQLMNINK
jgi:hypothetical protein